MLYRWVGRTCCNDLEYMLYRCEYMYRLGAKDML